MFPLVPLSNNNDHNIYDDIHDKLNINLGKVDTALIAPLTHTTTSIMTSCTKDSTAMMTNNSLVNHIISDLNTDRNYSSNDECCRKVYCSIEETLNSTHKLKDNDMKNKYRCMNTIVNEVTNVCIKNNLTKCCEVINASINYVNNTTNIAVPAFAKEQSRSIQHSHKHRNKKCKTKYHVRFCLSNDYDNILIEPSRMYIYEDPMSILSKLRMSESNLFNDKKCNIDTIYENNCFFEESEEGNDDNVNKNNKSEIWWTKDEQNSFRINALEESKIIRKYSTEMVKGLIRCYKSSSVDNSVRTKINRVDHNNYNDNINNNIVNEDIVKEIKIKKIQRILLQNWTVLTAEQNTRGLENIITSKFQREMYKSINNILTYYHNELLTNDDIKEVQY